METHFLLMTGNGPTRGLPPQLPKPGEWAWLDVLRQPGETLPSELDALGAVHPLIAARSQEGSWRPRLVAAGNKLLYVRLFDVRLGGGRLETEGLEIILGPSLLVTVHAHENSLFGNQEQLARESLEATLHTLLDPFIRHFEDAADQLDERSDALAHELLKVHRVRALAYQIYELRRDASLVARQVVPASTVIRRLASIVTDWTSSQAVYLHDLADRAELAAHSISRHRQEMAEMVETLTNLEGSRVNRIMKLLTVLTMALMPVTLVTGVYGMNFAIPEYHWPHGYLYALGLILVLSLGLLALQHWQGWLD